MPLSSYNKSQTGSSGNIHGLVLAAEQLTPSGPPGNLRFISKYLLVLT